MSATWATCRHQSPAVPSVYGVEFTSRNGRAPRCASVVRYRSTFARYCVFVADHGVTSPEPKSSFSAIHGVVQPVALTAKSKSLFAFATIAAGSAGLLGWPTRLFRYMSQ